MKTSVFRGLGLAAMSAIVLGALGCPAPSGGGGTAKVSSVVPPEGATAGGLRVMILGSNFEGGPASVYFDGVKATNVEVISDNVIECDVPPGELGLATVEVRSSGNTGRKSGAFEYLPGVESKEAANDMGGNDDFAGYERIPLSFDFQGYIGAAGDVDVLHMHPPDGGKIFVTLSWDDSFNAGGIAAMEVEFFQGPDPSPDPDAFFGGSIVAAHDGSGPPPRIESWMRPSFVVDGTHGPFLRIKAYGDGNHAGFDPNNPYILRIEYEADPTFEPFPQADSFRLALPLDPSSGPVTVTNNAAYDDDFDWYAFSAPENGWARIILSAENLGTISTAGEMTVGAKLFWVDPSDPDGNHVYSVEDAEVTAIDLPGPTARVIEVEGLIGLQTYVLRLTNTDTPGVQPYDYQVTLEYGGGTPESDEPGQLAGANDEQSAYNAGTLAGTPILLNGYLFHEDDDDWVRFTAGFTGDALVEWDHADIVSELGFYHPGTDPLGAELSLLVFDQAWYNSSGLPAIGAAIAYDGTVGSTKSALVPVTSGQNYYIFLNGIRGWSTTNDYTLSLTQQ